MLVGKLPVDFLAAVSESLPFLSVIHWARVSRAQRTLYVGDKRSIFPLGGLQFSRLTGKVQRNPTEVAAVEWASCICPDSLRMIDIDSVGDEPCPASATMLFSKIVEQASLLPCLVEVTFMKERSSNVMCDSCRELSPPSPSLVIQLLQKAPKLKHLQLWKTDCWNGKGWSDEETEGFVDALQSLGIRHEALTAAWSSFPTFQSRLHMFSDYVDEYVQDVNPVIRRFIRWQAQYFKSFPRFTHHLSVYCTPWLVDFHDNMKKETPLDLGQLDIDIRHGDLFASGKALADILTKCRPRELKLTANSDAREFQILMGLARCRRTFESVAKIDFSVFFASSDNWQSRAAAMTRVLVKFPCLQELVICTGFVVAGWKSSDTQTFFKSLPVLPSLKHFSFTGETCSSSAHDGVAFANAILTKLPNLHRFHATASDSSVVLGFRLGLENAILRGNALPWTLNSRWSIRLESWSYDRNDSNYEREALLLDRLLRTCFTQAAKKRNAKIVKTMVKKRAMLLTRKTPPKRRKKE
eukprot:TRINITY_DN17718_c0_g1_i7.p1 TRINITY_DN17718_c0_g1~~TRINITY_DN17718_c0_g1_i7.p1  ORF type:complete len:525 (+),score=79.07 TRINITY_DN17718_c0_g1_i7:1301-2875(+)